MARRRKTDGAKASAVKGRPLADVLHYLGQHVVDLPPFPQAGAIVETTHNQPVIPKPVSRYEALAAHMWHAVLNGRLAFQTHTIELSAAEWSALAGLMMRHIDGPPQPDSGVAYQDSSIKIVIMPSDTDA